MRCNSNSLGYLPAVCKLPLHLSIRIFVITHEFYIKNQTWLRIPDPKVSPVGDSDLILTEYILAKSGVSFFTTHRGVYNINFVVE